jgi:hypothetical protein
MKRLRLSAPIAAGPGKGLLAAALLAGALWLLACPAAAQGQPVYLVDARNADLRTRLLAASLQGIANAQPDGPSVYLLARPWDGDWLEYSLRLRPARVQRVAAQELLGLLRGEVKGQVIYDPAQPFTINLATTLAGLKRAVITDSDLGLPTLFDCRGKWRSRLEGYRWARGELLPACAERALAVWLPESSSELRDFCIARQVFVFYLDLADPEERELAQDVLRALPTASGVAGRADPRLYGLLEARSQFLVGAEGVSNLSFHSRLPAPAPLHQRRRVIPPTGDSLVTFIFSGPNDLGLAFGRLRELFADPARGRLPLGWAMPPLLAEWAPGVLLRYYAEAYRSGQDTFLMPASGPGRGRIEGAHSSFVELLSRLAEKTDMRVLQLEGPEGDKLEELPARLAEAITGGFVLSLPSTRLPGRIGGLPLAVTVMRTTSREGTLAALKRLVGKHRFLCVEVDPLSLRPSDIWEVARQLQGRMQVVGPEEFVELLGRSFLPTEEGPAAVRIVGGEYPEEGEPTEPLEIRLRVEGDPALVRVVYWDDSPLGPFFERARVQPDGSFRAVLPAFLHGGEVKVMGLAVDSLGRETWCPTQVVKVPAADADGDGLSDAEEQLFATQPGNADTDGDGLRDGNDADPLSPDLWLSYYLGPLRPPSEGAYLIEEKGTTGAGSGRSIARGGHCLYWLPFGTAPPGAKPALLLSSSEKPELAAGTEREGLEPVTDLKPWRGGWYWELPEKVVENGGLFLRVSGEQAALWALAVSSSPGGSSISAPRVTPAYPGAGEDFEVRAQAFHPAGIASVELTYLLGRGRVRLPMNQEAGQVFSCRLPGVEEHQRIACWITATDEKGGIAASPLHHLQVGTMVRDTFFFLPGRDVFGGWEDSEEWEGRGMLAAAEGATDRGELDLPEGSYHVWLLARPRGGRIRLLLDDVVLGEADPRLPDGWQKIGRVMVPRPPRREETKRYSLLVVSGESAGAPAGASPGYGEVILTADPLFRPPANAVLDMVDSLRLLSPREGERVSGVVKLEAAASGNVFSVRFQLDGKPLAQALRAPFSAEWDTRRSGNGEHVLGAEALGRRGETLLAVEVKLRAAN